MQPNEVMHGGCQMGVSMLTVEADKSIYACRRLPIKVGRIEDKFSLYDVFMKSDVMHSMVAFSKCKKCKIYNHCRGCVASAYKEYSDVTQVDPSCWRMV